MVRVAQHITALDRELNASLKRRLTSVKDCRLHGFTLLLSLFASRYAFTGLFLIVLATFAAVLPLDNRSWFSADRSSYSLVNSPSDLWEQKKQQLRSATCIS
jgi:hypothetical protein